MKAVLIYIINGMSIMSGCNSEKNLSKDEEDSAKLYQCSICKLHFTSKEVAVQCDDWCKNNNSCNMEIAGQSIEAIKAKKRN